MKQKQAGIKRRLVIFVLEDPEPMLWGSEPIFRDGQPVGYTTSGFYGHSVGGAIAMGYVSNAAGVSAKFIESGHYEINISGRRYRAKAHLRAPYDPDRKKLLSGGQSGVSLRIWLFIPKPSDTSIVVGRKPDLSRPRAKITRF